MTIPAGGASTASEALVRQTNAEHEALERAVKAMEKALASPLSRRKETWIARTRREIANVVGLLQEHGERAEAPDGLLGEAEVRVGRTYEVSEAKREHKRLLRETADLLSTLDEFAGGEQVEPEAVRRRGAEAIESLRAHQAREAGIMMLAFELDVGVPD